MTRRRLSAIAALGLAAATTVFALAVAVSNFPNALVVLACLALAVMLAWYGIRRRGAARAAGLAGAVLALVGSFVLIVVQGSLAANVIVLAAVAVTLGAATRALTQPVELSPATRPERPVLFMNPRSGGGKATRFHLADEARKRGIE